jgi:hypothetical protein
MGAGLNTKGGGILFDTGSTRSTATLPSTDNKARPLKPVVREMRDLKSDFARAIRA